MKLNGDFMTKRKFLDRSRTAKLEHVQEFTYKDNWTRLSRGLSNFKVSSEHMMRDRNRNNQEVGKEKELSFE